MLSFLRKIKRAALISVACAGSGGFPGIILPAGALSLSSDPYIKAPPYQPPPLSAAPSVPLGGRPPAHSAESRAPYNPPLTEYRPRPTIHLGKAAQHELWCTQNHPSYRPTDNSYRPFDRSNTVPPQMRVPCISPYSE